MATILVEGASGATGKLLVEKLLVHGHFVKAIIRPTAIIPQEWYANNKITIINAQIHEMTVEDMALHLKDCHAVASCLGHNLTLKGVFGKPKKLVWNAVKLICDAILINKPVQPIKFVLMNTVGNINRDIVEPISLGHKMVMALVRMLVPPQSDNEEAADHLRLHIGQNHQFVHWCAVRPDSLIDEEKVTEYSLHVSPTRSAIFNPGKTSRINVAHFMANLIGEDDLWNTWKGKMPVLYNQD